MERKVKTPCVGVCSTVFGDQVCRGCKRFQHEVIQWNSYSDLEKEKVWNRLETLKVLIMKSKILIQDKTLLKNKLDLHNISYYEKVDPYCWVFDLIKQGSKSVTDIKEFGLEFVLIFLDRRSLSFLILRIAFCNSHFMTNRSSQLVVYFGD